MTVINAETHLLLRTNRIQMVDAHKPGHVYVVGTTTDPVLQIQEQEPFAIDSQVSSFFPRPPETRAWPFSEVQGDVQASRAKSPGPNQLRLAIPRYGLQGQSEPD